jgi:hypothetical protein
MPHLGQIDPFIHRNHLTHIRTRESYFWEHARNSSVFVPVDSITRNLAQGACASPPPYAIRINQSQNIGIAFVYRPDVDASVSAPHEMPPAASFYSAVFYAVDH